MELGLPEFDLQLGVKTTEAGNYALNSLEKSVDDLASSKIDVLVTAPINKMPFAKPDLIFLDILST